MNTLLRSQRATHHGKSNYVPEVRKRSFSATRTAKVVLGIRKEDPGRLWERRCPVPPDAVNELVRQGVQVLVQPCDRRVWSDDEFVKAGATLNETLRPANIVIGIKETPLSELDRLSSPVDGRERTHVMFSHTAKGQLYNMPLLSRFVNSSGTKDNVSPRLVDYELLAGPNGKRVVAFGWFAGAAGLVEGLCASAHDFLSMGVSSPFLYLPRPYSHPRLADMRRSLRAVGEMIVARGMPSSTGPFVIAVTGNGNVAAGALDLLKELPTSFVQTADLPALLSDPDTDLTKVYVVHVPSSAYLFKKGTQTVFDRADYYANPNNYESHFHEKVAPYISVLINGAGWATGFPRILPSAVLPESLRLARQIGRGRFRTIADISCDINGGIEFVSRSCTIDEPFFNCDRSGREIPSSQPPQDGVQVMSVDILPSEIPRDASTHFSKALKPYLGALIKSYRNQRLDEEDRAAMKVVDGATIARNGVLLPKHTWLQDLVQTQPEAVTRESIDDQLRLNPETPSKTPSPRERPLAPKKKVLLLGSGMVSKPAVDLFMSRSDIELIVASNLQSEATALTRNFDRARAVFLDVSNQVRLDELISSSDVVVSLLPAAMHPIVARTCIKHRKNLVTASYISPGMLELDDPAKSADILLLNEIGLDPGIDHCSATDLRERIEAEGRRVISFVSWCGGLPAPEDSNGPLGMKFSWSPRGLLTAALNDATFKRRNQIRHIPGSFLLSTAFPDVPLVRGLSLEGLANRDSLPYAKTYQLGPVDGMHDIFRGTLRYHGFSRSLDLLRRVGLMSMASEDKVSLQGSSGGWYSLVGTVLEKQLGSDKSARADPFGALCNAFGTSKAEDIWHVLEQLCLVSSSKADGSKLDMPPLPTTSVTPLDALATLLSHRLRYLPGERDMVILSHEIVSVQKNDPHSGYGQPKSAQTHTSTLVTYGTPSIPGASAMSHTVGMPLAIAALHVLDGRVRERGVKSPGECGRPLWKGVMDGLEENGITMRETIRTGAILTSF